MLPAAVGFEPVHTGSLLHNDIIDQDAVRRGRPAVHAAFCACVNRSSRTPKMTCAGTWAASTSSSAATSTSA
ncbi:polyprenyl synthetase family protein [Streptomyces sp. NPDC059564]|uniref:polyprenyl synthetase family protein n=1 Tax=Streptomyces sp. NPDC059564 TaxID=3346865 RepID=UPI0036C91300